MGPDLGHFGIAELLIPFVVVPESVSPGHLALWVYKPVKCFANVLT